MKYLQKTTPKKYGSEESEEGQTRNIHNEIHARKEDETNPDKNKNGRCRKPDKKKNQSRRVT
ncbi:hypothetical protein E2C01_036045 [Portunus trituberculatus]|uniref:Uncharacterized protein n=1 Tax=Portunus trituberculatus TaxID=210409 RepID=A0A5B7FD48_PORTR|nr:hypothetical protein [Portunus trituberculatus]